MTDEEGNEVKTYAYDAWGKVTSETGSSSNQYKFTSREFEDEIGLQFNRARFYDPALGRFITRDPLTGGPDDPTISYFSGVYSQFHRFIKEHVDALQPDKHNRYVYCYNNPVNLIDPLGLSSDVEASEELKDKSKEEIEGKNKEQKPPVDLGPKILEVKDNRIQSLLNELRNRKPGQSNAGYIIGNNTADAIENHNVKVVDLNDLNKEEKTKLNIEEEGEFITIGMRVKYTNIIIIDFKQNNPDEIAVHEVNHFASKDQERVDELPPLPSYKGEPYQILELRRAEFRARIVTNEYAGRKQSNEHIAREVSEAYNPEFQGRTIKIKIDERKYYEPFPSGSRYNIIP